MKAFLIYENPKYVEGGRLARQLLNGHSLSKLQQACRKIPSPKRTRHVFETLEVGVNSWARYPCSTSSERETEERSVTPSSGQSTTASLTCTANDWKHYFPSSGAVHMARHQKSPSRSRAVGPNPSLKRSANGKPPGPVWRYAVHFRQPGPGVLPSSPA